MDPATKKSKADELRAQIASLQAQLASLESGPAKGFVEQVGDELDSTFPGFDKLAARQDAEDSARKFPGFDKLAARQDVEDTLRTVRKGPEIAAAQRMFPEPEPEPEAPRASAMMSDLGDSMGRQTTMPKAPVLEPSEGGEVPQDRLMQVFQKATNSAYNPKSRADRDKLKQIQSLMQSDPSLAKQSDTQIALRWYRTLK